MDYCFFTVSSGKFSFIWCLSHFKVAAKDLMNLGDQILLPITVEEFPSEKHEYHCNDEEINFVHNLELYKVPYLDSFCWKVCYVSHPISDTICLLTFRIQPLLLSINLRDCLFRYASLCSCLISHSTFGLLLASSLSTDTFLWTGWHWHQKEFRWTGCNLFKIWLLRTPSTSEFSCKSTIYDLHSLMVQLATCLLEDEACLFCSIWFASYHDLFLFFLFFPVFVCNSHVHHSISRGGNRLCQVRIMLRWEIVIIYLTWMLLV